MQRKSVPTVADDPVLKVRSVEEEEREEALGGLTCGEEDPTLSALEMASGDTLFAIFPQRSYRTTTLKAGERILWLVKGQGGIAGGYVGQSTIPTDHPVPPSLELDTDLRSSAFPVRTLRLHETRWHDGVLEVKWDDRIGDVIVHPSGFVETPEPYLDSWVVRGINLPPGLKRYFEKNELLEVR